MTNETVPDIGFLGKVDKTLRYHGQQLARGLRGLWWDMRQPRAERPVFILGCSRAGTTLVYKAFSVARELGTLQRETHDFWDSLHPVAERGWNSHVLKTADASATDRNRVTRYFYQWSGRLRFADKNNQNGLCVPYLQALFPDAIFVYVKRSPGDNLNSLIEGWRRPEEFATWSGDLPGEVRIDAGAYSRWCFFLPEGWREHLNDSLADVCAWQYASMNAAILDARENIPAAQWYELKYEDILQAPVESLSQAFSACGLKVDQAVRTRLSDVVKTPYNAFSPIRADKWRTGPNQALIETALPAVATVARRMGYDPAAGDADA